MTSSARDFGVSVAGKVKDADFNGHLDLLFLIAPTVVTSQTPTHVKEAEVLDNFLDVWKRDAVVAYVHAMKEAR